jgi:hypothetical protein
MLNRMHPSKRLTAALYSDYFAGPVMNVDGMSSHWRAYAPRSFVGVDADGVPIDAVGVGFGDMNACRRGNALFTTVAALLHATAHPEKRQLVSALAVMWSLTRRARLVFNQDVLRQAFTLSLLAARFNGRHLARILLIGDGYGLLGAALAKRYPAAQICFLGLGRLLLFQALTCERAFPEDDSPPPSQALVGRDRAEDIARARFVYGPADRLYAWHVGPVDLAVNVASMQQVSADVVSRYFDLLRRAPTTWFYCCNRERKELPGGEVSDFMKYPWSGDDEHLLDGLCPWHQWYVAPRRRSGLVPVSLRVPYDGPHLHRLTKLAPAPVKQPG